MSPYLRITIRLLVVLGISRTMQKRVKEGIDKPIRIGKFVLTWCSAGHFVVIPADDWIDANGRFTDLKPNNNATLEYTSTDKQWLFAKYITPLWMARVYDTSGRMLGKCSHRSHAKAIINAQVNALPLQIGVA